MKKEGKNSLLIVDDDTGNLMELVDILQSEYNIYTAKDGTSALSRAEKFMPDLILLDIIMPGMSGYEVLGELQKSDNTMDIPVIFITGLGLAEEEQKGFSLGAVDYIVKPFNSVVVKHRIYSQMKIINLQHDLDVMRETYGTYQGAGNDKSGLSSMY